MDDPNRTAAPDAQRGTGLTAVLRWRRLRWGAFTLIVVTMGIVYFQAARSRPAVTVIELAPARTERILAVTGRVRPRESVLVYSRVPGQVLSLTRDEGESIVRGEVLGRIDDARARAATAQAQSAVDAQRKVLEQAERDLERSRALRADGTVSEAALEAAMLAVTSGRDELRRLEAARDQFDVQLKEHVIVAPLTGRILSRPVDPGQVVGVSTPIFSVAPIADREVETEVDETYSMSLAIGQRARMRFAGSAEPVQGIVSYLSPHIDISTGGRTVRLASTALGDGMEMPVGLSVDVNIIVEERDDALTLPRTAAHGLPSLPHVFVVEDGKVARRDIVFRDWPSSTLIVDSGVSAGDRVIVSPNPPPAGTEVEAAPGADAVR